MIGVLLAALSISALLILTHVAMSLGLSLLRGDVPSWGPIRHAAHAWVARRHRAGLDREYEDLLSNHRLGGSGD